MAIADRITVVFVLSATRSGSTWLNVVLGSTSWAASVGEYMRPFTVKGHVACRLCEAEGLSECTELHGIEAVAPRDAYRFAAERLGKRVIIDCSKELDWCSRFLGRDDIDARLIHLVRNPCGFVESEGRRLPDLSHRDLLDLWERKNREIEDFVAASGATAKFASYDDLADDPDAHFPKLCDFIGHSWEPAAIKYWLVPHHGLGGNGAAWLYLRNRKVAVGVTLDDAYYTGLTRQRSAADQRWRDRLPAPFCLTAVAAPYARHLQARLGTDWQRLLPAG